MTFKEMLLLTSCQASWFYYFLGLGNKFLLIPVFMLGRWDIVEKTLGSGSCLRISFLLFVIWIDVISLRFNFLTCGMVIILPTWPPLYIGCEDRSLSLWNTIQMIVTGRLSHYGGLKQFWYQASPQFYWIRVSSGGAWARLFKWTSEWMNIYI